MNKTELLNLVDTNREEIIDALRDADRSAYLYTECKYSVALFPDGHTEIRERLAGDNWWYRNDPALLEIGTLCHQYYDILRDNLASDELLSLMESEMDSGERVEYERYRADYIGTEEEEPDDWDALRWIEEDLPDLWFREKRMAAAELTTSQEAEDEYDTLIDKAVKTYLEYCEMEED